MVKAVKTPASPFYAGRIPAHIELPIRRLSAATTPSLDHVEKHSHYFWGKRYLLSVVPTLADPQVMVRGRKIILRVQVGSDEKANQRLLDEWYRSQVQLALPSLIVK